MTMTITRDELEAAIRTGNVLIVDALPASYYTQLHVPGAVNLVAEEVSERAGQLLPDKDALIVTYCSNAACPNSSQVAAGLEGIGYTNVRK
jgi:rhodanese-related sulfurtransferase